MGDRRADDLRVGVAGLGAIGGPVARRLDQGLPGLRLAAVGARDIDKATRFMADFAQPVPAVPLARLADEADVVVDCVPRAAFADVAEPAVHAGRILVTVSGGALLDRLDLVDRARETGARIVVATGAILGLDAVRAAAEGEIRSVTMVTRKPPWSLAGAPYLEAHGISLDGLDAPRRLFAGSARDGVEGFPANVNVVAALALAGIGPDATRLEIWADPALDRNTHEITVAADTADFSMRIANVPSENQRTGRITALSVVATLRRLVEPLVVGT